MAYLLDIIKFIYQIKNKRLDIESMNEFKAGRHFPQLVSLLFNISEPIPNLRSSNRSDTDLANFRTTLTFLRRHNISVKSYKVLPNLSQKEEILLKVITSTIFKMDIKGVFEKSKLFLQSKNLDKYENENDIFSGKFLLTLLNALTNGEVAIPKRVNDKTDFNKLIVPTFQKNNIPLVIDSNSFDINNPVRFLIQVQIIFTIYSNEINDIEESNEEESDDFYEPKLESMPKYLMKGKRTHTRNIILKPPTTPQIPIEREASEPIKNEEESIYQDNIFVNIANTLIKDQSEKKITAIESIFMKEVDILFSIVQNAIGEDIKFSSIREMLRFLSNHFSEAKYFDQDLNLSSRTEQKGFIIHLLDCSYFQNEKNAVFKNRCKSIFHDFRIEFDDFKDFFTSKGLHYLLLLQKVAFKKFSDINFVNYPPPSPLTIPELHKYFKKLNIPFILVNDSFSKYENETFYKYQAKLIIDQFDAEYLKNIDFNSDFSKEDNYPPVLKAINAIGARKGIHFSSISSVIDGRLLPYFVECLLQKSLSDQIQINKSQQLTEEESEQNVDTIIQFLKTQKSKFNILLLDFKDPRTRESSAKILCKNLLNLFFLKKSKNEYLDRCDSILSTKFRIKSINDFTRGKPFFGLLFFLTHYNIHFKKDIFDYLSFDNLKKEFKNANIPMIIDRESFDNPASKDFVIFYQLQFIFEKLDSDLHKSKPSLVVTEIFLEAVRNLLKFKILDSQEELNSKEEVNLQVISFIKNSALAKQGSSENRLKMSYDRSTDDLSSKTTEPKSFEDVISKLRQEKEEKEREMNLFDRFLNDTNTMIYWNPNDYVYETNLSIVKLDKHISYEKGYLFIKRHDKKFSPELKYSNYLKDDLNKFFNDKNARKALQNAKNVNKVGVKEKLYKIYVYNQDLKKWEFNFNEFQQFINDKKLDDLESLNQKKFLVLFLNSHEDDLIKLNSNFLDNAYPDLDDDQLFVYALTHNYGKSIKPIFLLLHIPQGTKNTIDNIASAIVQIYCYLYLISDIRIVLMNTQLDNESVINNIFNQIETTKIIDYISKKSNIVPNNNNSRLILLANHPVLSYKNDFVENCQNKGKFWNYLKDMGFPKMKMVPVSFKIINSEDLAFRDMITDMSLDIQTSLSNISLNLQSYPQYEISSLYLNIRSQLDNIENPLKECIEFRLGKGPSNLELNLTLLDEFALFTPQNDIEFNQIYRSIIYNSLKKMDIETILSNKLKSVSVDLITILKDIIKSKYYWENQQISIIKNSYILLLEEVFYNVIFICKFGRLVDIIYQDLYEILDNQKNQNKVKIEDLFSEYIGKIIKRNEEITKDLKNDLIKSTKYVMKETENLKDREVLIGIKQNLEDVIEQDF